MRPRSGTTKPKECLDERALAGAVWPEQPDRADRKRGRDFNERGLLPVDDGHLFEGDDRRWRWLRRFTVDAFRPTTFP